MPEQVTPEPIMQVATGFMAAKHLFVASELGLFETLADGPATLDGLAARTGLTPRATRISADAMVALGLLETDGDHYRNGAAASAFLTGGGPGDLRPFLRFWDKLSYPAWEGLADALARGPSTEIFDLDAELQQISAAGIEAILAGPANALAATFGFSAHRRLLDVGGGTGSWSIAAVGRHEHLSATVLELPVQADVARKRVADEGLADRVDVVTGDAMGEELPTGYDVFLLANLVHSCTTGYPNRTGTSSRGSVGPPTRARTCSSRTSGPTRRTPSPSSQHSWPASSRSTYATATSTAPRKAAPGWPAPGGRCSTTARSPAPSASSSRSDLTSTSTKGNP